MSKAGRLSPRCIIIAGPNGAGKTTFAREFLAKGADIIHFVHLDLIASGLSPLRPELAAFAAGRLFFRELDRLANAGDDSAFESALSGLGDVSRLRRWKAAGRRIEMVYLRISSLQLALRRIAARVKQGGHNVTRRDVLRRFTRSWNNFEKNYRLLADAWSVYDNSGSEANSYWKIAMKRKAKLPNKQGILCRHRPRFVERAKFASRPHACTNADLSLEERQSRR